MSVNEHNTFWLYGSLIFWNKISTIYVEFLTIIWTIFWYFNDIQIYILWIRHNIQIINLISWYMINAHIINVHTIIQCFSSMFDRFLTCNIYELDVKSNLIFFCNSLQHIDLISIHCIAAIISTQGEPAFQFFNHLEVHT